MKTNWFSVPLENDKVYIYEVRSPIDDRAEYHKFLAKMHCVSLDENKRIVVCLDKHDEFELKGEKNICELSDLGRFRAPLRFLFVSIEQQLWES